VFAAATFALGALLVLVLVVFTVGRATESGTVEVKLGSDTFNAGPAQERADSIRDGGPFLFSDVSGGQRDIFLQHAGPDPKVGWLAFDARRPGRERSCALRWDRDAAQFVDSCDGTVVAADGAGLTRYAVSVNEEGNVIVDLNADRRRAPNPADSTPTSSSTSTSIRVTGSR
jgi:hypothetical protein